MAVSVQDLLALSEAYSGRPAQEETINDPTVRKHYWRYRWTFTHCQVPPFKRRCCAASPSKCQLQHTLHRSLLPLSASDAV